MGHCTYTTLGYGYVPWSMDIRP